MKASAPGKDLPFWKRPITFKKSADANAPKLSAQARSTLIRQIATLTTVMPVTDAVATLARQPASDAEKRVLHLTHKSLQSGTSLASALPPSAFPAEVRATIAAGEASGRLPLLLTRMADALEAQVALRSRLISALAYPALLILVALGVITAMLVFVVPSIAAQLMDSGQPLPLLTRAVLAISDFAREWGLLFLTLMVSAMVGFWLWAKRPDNRAMLDAALLRVPVVGNWISALEAVRWSRLLSTMLSAGLPLAEGLAITSPTMGNHSWRAATQQITTQVRAGSSLSASLPLLPNPPGLLVALAQSGESSGRLAPLLESAAQSLDRQISDRSRTLLSLAEPAIIVVLGGAVGMIILAVLLPILQLNTLAGAGIGAP